jgi:O-antigen ligase
MKISINSLISTFAIIAIILPIFSTRIALVYVIGLSLLILFLKIRHNNFLFDKSTSIAIASFVIYSIMGLIVYLVNQVNIIHYMFYVGMPLIYLFIGLSKYIKFNDRIIFVLLCLLLIAIFFFVFRDLQNNFTFQISKLRILHRGIVVTNDSNVIDSFFLQNNTTMSVYFLMLCAVCMILYYQRNNYVYMFIFIVISFFIFVLNTRSAYLALFLITVIHFFVVKNSFTAKTVSSLIAFLMLAIIIYLFIESYSQYFARQLIRLTDTGFERSLETRYELYWLVAWEMFHENIFGYGHRLFFEKYGGSIHNDYLGQLVSVGFFASILYYSFLIYTLILSFQLMKKEDEKIHVSSGIIFYSIIIYFVVSLTEQLTFSANEWIYLKYLLVGIFYSDYNDYRKQES